LLTASLLGALDFDLRGRVDAGPAYFHVRVLEDRETIEKIDVWGGRIDATIFFFEDSGYCLKPFLYGAGGAGDLYGGGIGIGRYTPLCHKLVIVPTIGYSYTSLALTTDLINVTDVGEFRFPGVREHFQAGSVYIGTEVIFKLKETLTATAIYQYAFAWSHTNVRFPTWTQTADGNSQGSNVALVFDYQWNPAFALTAAFGYNSSLNEQKFGIEGFGIKLGVAYCFY
jgi:hypothetical protein